MGYELKKLMNMYGVSTPTMAAAPQKPGDAPTALADGATAEQQEKYAADKAVFDENVRKYGLNQAQYDQYMRDYQNRLASTNMYNQAQFNTSGVNMMPQFADMLQSPVYQPLADISVMPTTSVVPPVDTMSQTPMISNQGGGGRDRDGMGGMGGMGRPGNGTGTGSFGLPDPFGGGSRNMSGGYTSFGDRFDGGGPGVKGGPFQGGGRLSDIANAVTGRGAKSSKKYAQGGAVQGYQRGGPPGTIYGGAGDDMLMGGSEEDTLPPVDPNAALEAMLNRYAPQTVTSEQIAAASERRLAEQKAFEDILRSQLQSTDSNPMSKAEKYFRLAAAFGAPTKTGHFSENLALVGETLAEDLAAKAQREREARERGLGVELEIQKMRMGAAGEEYDALRGVQSEEAKYRRDVANELLKEQIASGKAGYTQVTGAELGLTGDNADKLFNVSPEGQVTAIGGAGTTVNVGGGSQDKLDEEFAKLDAKSLAEVSTTGMQAIRNIGRLDHLETILADSPQGLEGAAKLFAGEFGINTEGLDSAQTAQAVINSLVPEQRAPGSGPMSDADLALFKQSLPRIINQPGGNEMILNTLRAIAQYDAEGAAIVQQFRAKEIDSVKAFELLQARENPLANFRAPGATEGGGGGSTIRTWNPETQELE